MTPRVPALKFSPDELTRAWQSASILMDYPDEDLFERLDLLSEVATSLPAKLGAGLQATIDHLRGQSSWESQSDYVDTFDTRRRGCLFLTYFSNGETRKRGLALLRIKQVYLKAGLILHLVETDSPWRGALETVCMTLPALKGKDHEAVERLIAEGPEDEQVGLSPYGMPDLAPMPGGA